MLQNSNELPVLQLTYRNESVAMKNMIHEYPWLLININILISKNTQKISVLYRIKIFLRIFNNTETFNVNLSNIKRIDYAFHRTST